MKVLQINIFGNLSTGRIAVDIYRTLIANGHEGMVAFARNSIPNDVPYIKIGNLISVYLDGIFTRITDRAGFFSKGATKKLIKRIKEYDPDIIHLHNLHGYYINIEELFKYLSESGKPVVWTLHDCWAFTGHCCYYSMIKCDKWMYGCNDCPQKKSYPTSYICDNSMHNYKKKREIFTSISNIQLITVSKWLEKEVKKSFLKDLPCSTIYNGIDLTVFKPTESDFRKKYGLENKFIVLGVASTWGERKGLDDFIVLSNMLNEDCQIVLVGVDKYEKKRLPSNIISIERTDSVNELAGLYTVADVYFNASVEETFGLPTVEAMACGTPVIVYDVTALPEVVSPQTGFVIKEHDLKHVVQIIENLKKRVFIFEGSDCNYDMKNTYQNYVNLYLGMLEGKES